MEKLYYCIGFIFFWYCVGRLLSLLLDVFGKLAAEVVAAYIQVHIFGAYLFGYNVIWRSNYTLSGVRHNMIRHAYRQGFKVRRWGCFVIATR